MMVNAISCWSLILASYNKPVPVLLIAWERPEYTVMERDGFFKACVTINASNTDTITTSNIRFTEITAKEGEGIILARFIHLSTASFLDFVRPTASEAVVMFRPHEPRIKCYNFSLIIDIAHEPTESFIAHIRFHPSERIIYNDVTTIYIIDYNGEQNAPWDSN